jgi:hypothetical protein
MPKPCDHHIEVEEVAALDLWDHTSFPLRCSTFVDQIIKPELPVYDGVAETDPSYQTGRGWC